MPRFPFSMTVTRRVWALASLAFATMGLGTALALLQFHAASLEERRSELQQKVEIAAALLKGAAAMGSDGSPAAVRAALEQLRPVRFGESGYFYAYDPQGVALLCPIRPDKEGQNLLGETDSRGAAPIRALLEIARSQGSGFVTYHWVKPGSGVEAEKVGFVRAIPELGLVVGSGVYIDDVTQRTIEIGGRIALYVAPLLLLFLAAAWSIGHGISARLRAMTEGLNEMAQGNYDIVLPGLDRGDEIAEMARAVEAIKTGTRETARSQNHQRDEQRRQADRARAGEMGALAQNFDSAVGGVVEAVAQATHKLENFARSLVQEARYSGEQAEVGARAAETASQNVQSVAAAAEQLTYSVDEIGGQASRSRNISSDAAREAETTRDRAAQLVQAIDHIGGIVATITGIAQQTNMLALNATIEAARAGEQGRGFAVVAQEVKTLAEQTANATADVAEQIAGIQRASQEANACIGAMTQATLEVNSIASAIATAVGSQGEATREIARNVQETSARTEELNKVIDEVRSASRQSGDSAEQVLLAVTELAGQTERLRGECDRFLAQVRAA